MLRRFLPLLVLGALALACLSPSVASATTRRPCGLTHYTSGHIRWVYRVYILRGSLGCHDARELMRDAERLSAKGFRHLHPDWRCRYSMTVTTCSSGGMTVSALFYYGVNLPGYPGGAVAGRDTAARHTACVPRAAGDSHRVSVAQTNG
jgi:hypothetical protein